VGKIDSLRPSCIKTDGSDCSRPAAGKSTCWSSFAPIARIQDAAAWPVVAVAEQSDRIWRIGVRLNSTTRRSGRATPIAAQDARVCHSLR
jgi:hypothetical protein